jgi:UDP-2,3-diacylglucosamine pyrophosphatase LpxH
MYFIGDVHGEFTELIDRISLARIKKAILIQVGDFGLGFHSIEEDYQALNELNKFLLQSSNRLYVIRGNHDNPSFFKSNIKEWSNIHLLVDYSVLTIENNSILFVGGALSVDRCFRKLEKNYWKDENFVYDLNKLDDTLATNKKLDIIVTHTAPSFAWPQTFDPLVKRFALRDETLLSELDAERLLVDQMFQRIRSYTPALWVYGHFHASHSEQIDSTKFRLLNIMEIFERI